MKKFVKKGLIKDVAYSYLMLVVLPVLVVFSVIFLIAGRYIYRARLNSVEVTRQAVFELYEEERKSAALSLSHILNFKDGEVIRDAAGNDEQKVKTAEAQIDSIYQLMNIISWISRSIRMTAQLLSQGGRCAILCQN